MLYIGKLFDAAKRAAELAVIIFVLFNFKFQTRLSIKAPPAGASSDKLKPLRETSHHHRAPRSEYFHRNLPDFSLFLPDFIIVHL
jgi:hypothetical protein